MAKHNKKKPKILPTKDVEVEFKEGVADDMDEAGHVIVVTQFGLAMLVAGLRAIKEESPEVNDLLDTLEDALRQGMEERMNARPSPPPPPELRKPKWGK